MLRKLALALALVCGWAGAAYPQDDDWSVSKSPFDKRIIARWKAVLERDPWDAAALRQLTSLYKRYSSVDKLIGETQPTTWSRAVVLAQLYRMLPDVDKALEAYARAAGLAPAEQRGRIRVARAELLKQKGDAAAARKEYEAALDERVRKPDAKLILRALAELALDGDDVAAASAYFKRYIELDPGDVSARIDHADVLVKHEKWQEALTEYELAERHLSTDPQRRVEVMVRRAAVLAALGRDDDAVAVYQKADAQLPRGHHLRREIAEHTIGLYRKKQDLRGLLSAYEKAWRDRGHFEWEVLGRLYEETGDVDRALECYRKAVAAAPTELETHRRLIAILERTGRDDEALRQYETLVRVAPGDPRFQLELAERVFRRGDRPRALALLKAIGARFYSDPGVHSALADLYYRWGEDKLALKEYEILTRLEPDDDTHLVNLGEQYFQRGDKAKAIEVWKRLAGGKATAEGTARLAEVYAEHDMGAEAIEMYQKAIALRPRDPGVWRGFASVLERQRHDDRALEAWEKVIEHAGTDPAQKALRREARSRIIVILHRRPGTPLLAKLTQWRTRFEATPPDLESGYRLVEGYLRLGRYEDAERTLSAILRADPKDLDAKTQLVSVYKSQKKYTKAIELLKQLAAEQPALERQYFQEISELELALYHDEEAVAFAQRALEKNPNDAQAQERLADIHAKRGDIPKAVDAYKRAIALDPRNHRVRFALATLYVNSDQRREAARLYREIVRSANEEEVVRKAARKAMTLEEHEGSLGELERELAPLAFLPGAKAYYRKILVELYDRYTRPLILAARGGDAAAQKELTRLGEHGLKPLLEALEDPSDPQQQRTAAYVLGYVGNKNASAPLTKLALEDGATGRRAPETPHLELGMDSAADMDLRVEALVAAGRLGDPRVIPQLAVVLKHREVALREAAAWALGQTRSPKAADALLLALGDSRASVHALACVGLGRVGDKRALDRATEVVRDRARAPEARAACAYALGAARAAPSVSALMELLGAGNDDAQVKAAWALGRIGDAHAVPALVRAVFTRRQAIRDAALWALARVGKGDDRPLPLEDVSLEREKIDYRRLVRELVADLEPEPVDPAILAGQGPGLAEAVAAGLTGGRDVKLRTLRDLDADPAGVALGPFGRGTKQALDAVIPVAQVDRLCDDKDAEVRALAVSVLAKTGDRGAPARIARLLADPARDVRIAALRAAERYTSIHGAGALGAGGLAGMVADRLGADDGLERAAAADVLGRMPGADLAPLVPALAAPDGFVREAAVRALGSRAGSWVTPLLDATRDEVVEVRLAAVQMLRHVPDGKVRTRLREMADADPSPRVRAEARVP